MDRSVNIDIDAAASADGHRAPDLGRGEKGGMKTALCVNRLGLFSLRQTYVLHIDI